MIYYAKLEGTKINGFYIEDFHGKELCENLNHIKVDEALHDYMIDSGSMILNGAKESRLYTINDKVLFYREVIEDIILPPQLEERIAALEAALMGVL